jgi:hypothetical protein
MRTLLLAERPFRDLRSRALLAELPGRLALDQPLIVLSPAPTWPAGFTAVPPETDPATLGAARALIAGIHLERQGFDRILAHAARAVSAGARLELRHFSLDGGAVRPTPPEGIGILDAAQAIEVRDHFTADALMVWRVAAPLRIAPYPERVGEADATLAAELPEGPVLGLSILGGDRARSVWGRHLDLLRERLALCRGWPVLPLPAEPVDGPMDDYTATLAFAEAVLPGSPVLLPRLADSVYRRRQLTVARMRGLVARCRMVVASQDLPAAMAVGLGVPVLGIAMAPERRISSCLATLANVLPPGSDLLMLR